jgi:predicted nuclease of restriction endonuclease-like (RecB) superfamily
MVARKSKSMPVISEDAAYAMLAEGISDLIRQARHQATRAVNAILTVTYWEVGRRIVEFEQQGEKRAEYGEELLKILSSDLTAKHGRGFAKSNLYQMRAFYLAYSNIFQTLSGKSLIQSTTPSHQASDLIDRFPLPWSHYVRLLSLNNPEARTFYEAEALRGGWSVRQLDRQISTQFYERTLLSKNKAAMLRKGQAPRPGEALTPEEEIKDPFILEFLDLKDEYSESDLEAALIQKLEAFLLELGGDFAFVGRQRRLRIGGEWYRVDLLFFHRVLRCLVVIDLKLGKFTHADAGQMHLYLNYAREHLMREGENPPVGLILCAERDRAVARYALEGLPNKILAAEYKLALPTEQDLAEQTRKLLEEIKR